MSAQSQPWVVRIPPDVIRDNTNNVIIHDTSHWDMDTAHVGCLSTTLRQKRKRKPKLSRALIRGPWTGY
jgi:hypothetical protein